MITLILFYVLSWFTVGLLTQALYRAVGKQGILSGYDRYFWSALLGYATPFIIIIGSLIKRYENKS